MTDKAEKNNTGNPEAVPDRGQIIRLLVLSTAAFFLFAAALVFLTRGIRAGRIRTLEKALDTGDTARAERILDRLENDESTADYFLRFDYLSALEKMESGSYEAAASAFTSLGNYRDADEMRKESLLRYGKALLEEGSFEEAERVLEEISGYGEAADVFRRARYERALAEETAGDRILAFRLFLKLGDYADSRRHAEEMASAICGTTDTDAALALIDGLSAEEQARRSRLLQSRAQIPEGLLAVGFAHTVGLRADGTVVCCGDNSQGQCDTAGWTGIKAVAAGARHTLGLRVDGTVIAAGQNSEGQCMVEGWRDIVAIAAADYASFGLREDGTVVWCGFNDYYMISNWTDVARICGGTYNAGALTKSGDALISHVTARSEALTGLVDLAVTTAFAAGLLPDGTVVCSDGRELPEWRDMVQLSAGSTSLLGLDAGGHVRSLFFRSGDQVSFGDIEGCRALCAGGTHFVFLLDDGSVAARGENDKGQCDTEDWNLFS